MTPQVQQVFAVPTFGAGGHAAVAPDGIGEDRLPQTGQPLDDLGDSFGKLMQADAAAVPGNVVPVPQTGPQPAEFAAQAAVAMQMLSSPVDAKGQRTNAPVVLTPDPSALVDDELDLAAGLADAFVVPLPITAAPVENLMPTMPLAAPKPDFAARVDTGGPPSVPPITPLTAKTTSLAIGLMTNAVEGATPTANIAAAMLMPAEPHQGAIPTQAPLTNIANGAENTGPETTENPHQTIRATPAETAFQLRAGSGVIKDQTDALAPPQPLSDGVTPKPFTAPVETAVPDAPADPTAEPAALPDRAAVPQIGVATDSALAAPLIGGADQIKQPPVVITQSGTFPTASPPVPQPLPPRLSADLVRLARSSPSGPVEILLNPEELGQLRFEIHQKADQLRVVLSVERPETMDLLRRNAEQLLGEFRAAGFTGVSLSFGQWDQQSSDPRPQPAPQPPVPERAFDPPPPPKHLHPPLQMAASTGLNMRL